MLTYIVEDDSLKADRLCAALRAAFESLDLQVFRSYQSGLVAIERNPPALLILDMTLPTFDRKPDSRAGRFRPLGGYELMRKAKLRGLRPATIVVTMLEKFGEGNEEIGFLEMTTMCNTDFPGMFLGSIYFQLDNLGWKKELISLVETFIRNHKI